MNQDLSRKVAVVTGGGHGIGAAIARKLAGMGATTLICGRNRARLEQTAKELGCEPFVCDISDWNSVAAMAKHTQEKFGRVDVLVNNAASRGAEGPLHTMPLENWDAVFNTNLRGVFYTVRAFVPLMIAGGGGDIINLSSIAGKGPLPNGATYSASKWGLNGLSYGIAEELRSQNIRVTAICPGSTNTEFSPHEGKDPKKMLQPDDVAHVVGMLLTQSPQAFVSEVVIRPKQKP
jgi:3-oxoacyl-[acyl-carrier protein] reductase